MPALVLACNDYNTRVIVLRLVVHTSGRLWDLAVMGGKSSSSSSSLSGGGVLVLCCYKIIYVGMTIALICLISLPPLDVSGT